MSRHLMKLTPSRCQVNVYLCAECRSMWTFDRAGCVIYRDGVLQEGGDEVCPLHVKEQADEWDEYLKRKEPLR